ncbi:MAG: PilZ domain-containing protein [Candidatus Omnitrophica bacterium]|nr:PilZ domain-containing protein [Candidatus Omnitrophota bacterium]
MIERRKHLRLQLNHKILFRDSSKETPYHSEGIGSSFDVSRGGLRVNLNSPITVGKKLDLTIMNNSKDEPVSALAQVVWSRLNEDSSYTAGMKFMKIGWTESDKLFAPANQA